MPTALASLAALQHEIATSDGKLIVVDFWATWCGPCVRFSPTYEAIAKDKEFENRVRFFKSEQSAGATDHYSIRAFPTFVLFLNGSEVGRMEGADESSLRALINKHIKTVQVFQGKGMTVQGAGPSASSAEEVRAARLARMAGGSGGASSSSSSSSAAPSAAAAASASPSGHSIAASAAAAPTPQVDPAMVRAVAEAMACSDARATTALLATRPTMGVDAAVEWLLAHPEEETPAATSASSSSSSSSAAAAAPAQQAEAGGSAAAAAAPSPPSGFTADEAAEVQAAVAAADAAEAAEAAGGGGGGGPPKRPLTAEEMQAKVEAMRAAKAAKAREEEKERELRRREDAAKGAIALAAQRKAEVEREAEARKREKAETERAMNRTRLEVLKSQAERESKGAGGVSSETMARLKYLQDVVDGKEPPPLPADIPAELKKRVHGLTCQKSDSIGLSAANLLLTVLGNLVKGGAVEEKYLRLNYSPGKPCHNILGPAPAALPLLQLLGWVRGTPGEDGSVFLTITPQLVAEKAGFIRDAIAQIEAAKAAGEFVAK